MDALIVASREYYKKGFWLLFVVDICEEFLSVEYQGYIHTKGDNILSLGEKKHNRLHYNERLRLEWNILPGLF